jgi:P27 family predicted phage terminase small subunit
MRGRKPVPTVLHERHGNPSKTAPPRAEPLPVGNLTDPPDWLTSVQRANWNYALAHSPPGLLKLPDRGVLVTWVVAEGLHRQAAVALSRTRLLTVTPNGFSMQSPYLAIINRQALIMMKAASELGFTPVSRPRLVMGTPERSNGAKSNEGRSFDAFLDGDPDAKPTIQ